MIYPKYILSAAIFLIGSASYCQDCSKLVKENEELKQQLKSLQVQYGVINNNEIEVKSIDNEIKVKILEVKGDKNRQAVIVTFQLLQETKPHQEVRISVKNSQETKAYDDFGKQYEIIKAKLGNQDSGYIASGPLPTGVAVNGELQFINILPSVARLKLVTVGFGTRNANGEPNRVEGLIELKNLQIQWK